MRQLLAAVVGVLSAAVAAGQGEAKLPKGDRTPVPQLDPGGPAAPVTALAFAPDGNTLYAAGLDKTIRVYRKAATGWVAAAPLRVPAGRANAGAINALAVSDDGRWLAAAGRAPMRDEAWAAAGGVVLGTARLPAPMRRDAGVVYVFDRANPAAGGKVLRGHTAAVRSLAFAAGSPVLISAAVEPGSDGKETGTVRAWDVAAETELAAQSGFPANPTRVGLGGWATGAGQKDLTVAVAWPEAGMTAGHLRLWDVARDAVATQPDGALNRALAVLRGADGKPDRVLSGGFANTGRVTVRPLSGGAGRAIPFPPSAGSHYLPLAAVPAGNLVALLLERSGQPAATRPTELVLLDPDAGPLSAAALAGIDAAYLPALAATADTVAVAGFADHRVEVYALADLRRGVSKPAVLTGGPPGFTGVRFLDGGTAVGLAAANGTELVFDFANRGVAPPGARKPDAPAAAGVAVQVVPPAAGGDRYEVRVAGIACQLDPGAVPDKDAVAYLPGKPAWMPALGPLVAVGHTDPANAHTLITLFDGTTGRPVRQLSGHLLPVRTLAFSAARPLLASAAADGTVCVWSLKDIDRPSGTIDGLTVIDRDGTVMVESADGPKLAAGDVIEAVAAKPVKSMTEFVWQASTGTPGKTLPVTVRGKGVVNLPVARGADERKPLFTLWVGPGGKDWAAWAPAGPYDASGPAAEARLGWLTNTGDPKAPTTFAGADQYREQFYQRGLLKALAEKADLALALEDFAPPPPRLAPVVREAVGRLVRGKATLRVELENLVPAFPLDAAELRYRVWEAGKPGEPKWATSPTTAPPPWDFELPGVAPRGAYTVEVELARSRGGPRVTEGTVAFTTAPPPPTLRVSVNGAAHDPGKTVAVKEPKVSLAVAATGPEPVAVTAAAGGDEKKLTPAADGTFAITVPLKPGDNTIRVRATNATAPADSQDAETAELAVTVRYDESMKEPAPAVGPIAFAPAGEHKRVNGKDVIVVSGPTVEASARITAAHPLARVGVPVGTDKPAALDPAGAKDFTARHKLTLKPGEPVRVTVTAATATSDPGEQSADVVYWPAPPALTVAPLAADSVTEPKLTVSGTFTPTAADVPFTIQVVASAPGRKPQSFDAKIDATARTWAADVTLAPGANTLAVVARNPWQARELADAATVAYRRPPQILVPTKEADPGATAVADVTLTVTSPADLPPTAVLVAGRPVPTDPPKKRGEKNGTAVWDVTAPRVPVIAGGGLLNELTVQVRNTEGESATATVAVKRTAAPKVAPPAVAVKAPPAATDADAIPVRFHVTSAGPLTRVEVQRAAGDGGDYEIIQEFDPKTAAKTDDTFALDGEASVPLRDGPNRVRVIAVGTGGQSEGGFTVGRVRPPVQVVIDGVDEVTDDGKPVGPLAAAGPRYGPAKSAFTRVRGHVRWARADDPGLTDTALTVAVSVNRVNLLPVRLGPAEGDLRRFEARLFLNGADNAVRVAVRGGGADRTVPLQRAAGQEFQVGCAKPLDKQRLHVVVVGVDVPDAGRGDLVRKVVHALGGDPRPGFEVGQFKAPGYDRAVLYDPVVGEVQRGDVRRVLAKVADTIRDLTADPKEDWVNDVVFVYYQGQDWVDPDDRRWLHTSQSLRYKAGNWQGHAVRADQLPESVGVKLLLLSVADADHRPDTARDAGVPLLRYGWTDPAARPRLVDLLGQALGAKVRLGDVTEYLRAELLPAEATAGVPLDLLSEDVRARRIGRGGQ